MLSQRPLEQVLASDRLNEAEATRARARLDLGIIELRPLNRQRLNIDKTFRWYPNRPVMTYFREQVAEDYFNGGFDGVGELLSVVHGSIACSDAAVLADRLQRVAQDFAMQHLADQRIPAGQLRPSPWWSG